MAGRTELTPIDLVRSAGKDCATTVDISTLVTDGAKIKVTRDDAILIRVSNTVVANDKTVTIKAGTFPYKSLGDLVVTVTKNGGVQVITFPESMRFAQADGYIYLDIASGFTGTIQVLRLPYPRYV